MIHDVKLKASNDLNRTRRIKRKKGFSIVYLITVRSWIKCRLSISLVVAAHSLSIWTIDEMGCIEAISLLFFSLSLSSSSFLSLSEVMYFYFSFLFRHPSFFSRLSSSWLSTKKRKKILSGYNCSFCPRQKNSCLCCSTIGRCLTASFDLYNDNTKETG